MSNFQDEVVLGTDGLSYLGDKFVIGPHNASPVVKSVVFAASDAAVHLAVTVFSGTQTIWLPLTGSGTLLTNINVSAGVSSVELSAVVFSNSNRVSFGLNGSTITAKHALNVSAGTTSQNISDQVVFSDSNNVSFGLNGSTITASASVASSQGSINVSAGTTSNNLSAVVFSNSNRVSFGLNGSTITAQHALNFSAGTTSQNVSDQIVFSNSNNVSFGLNGSTITATATVASTQGSINLSAGTTSNLASAFTFSNSNGISFGLNASTITASVATSLTNINVSAGTTSNNLSAITFSNSNGITFGLNGSTLTASIGTLVNVVNFSAGTTSNNLGSVVFSNSNGVSFGLNGSTITASVATSLTNINVSAGTTSNNLSAITFSNSNNATFGLNGSTITVSAPVNFSAGTTSNNLTNVVFSNSNGVVFGLNGSTITASVSALSTYEPYQAVGASTVLVGVPTATSAAVSVYPFLVNEYVSAGILNVLFSMSFVTVGTSSGRQTAGLAMAIYSRNVSTLSSIVSQSLSWQITGNNSSYSINQITATSYSGYGATAQTNSAGSNITSGYTGVKMIQFPINSLITPGKYWIGLIGTNSTSSINVGISISHFGLAMLTAGSAAAPMGSFSSAYSQGQDPLGGRWYVGQGSWTSAGSVTMVPASMNMTSISAVGMTYPMIKFWST